MRSSSKRNPFSGLAQRYLAYEQTPKGKLRSEMLEYQVRKWLKSTSSKNILDFGCGTGTLALTLAKIGHKVTATDEDKSMIKALQKRAVALSVSIDALQIDHTKLSSHFSPERFDFIICHSVLEFLPDSTQIIKILTWLLAKKGILSIEIANSNASVFYQALVKNDFTEAKKNIKKNAQFSNLVQSRLRSYTHLELNRLLEQNNLNIRKAYGVRIFSDYVPEKVLKNQKAYKELKKLEMAICSDLPYCYCGRYLHFIASKQ